MFYKINENNKRNYFLLINGINFFIPVYNFSDMNTNALNFSIVHKKIEKVKIEVDSGYTVLLTNIVQIKIIILIN